MRAVPHQSARNNRSEPLRVKARLSTAANGHAMLLLPSALRYLWFCFKLRRCGFSREGKRVIGPGMIEMVFPDVVRGPVRLHASYDEMSGYCLLSDSAEGDEFLTAFTRDLISRGQR